MFTVNILSHGVLDNDSLSPNSPINSCSVNQVHQRTRMEANTCTCPGTTCRFSLYINATMKSSQQQIFPGSIANHICCTMTPYHCFTIIISLTLLSITVLSWIWGKKKDDQSLVTFIIFYKFNIIIIKERELYPRHPSSYELAEEWKFGPKITVSQNFRYIRKVFPSAFNCLLVTLSWPFAWSQLAVMIILLRLRTSWGFNLIGGSPVIQLPFA